MSGLMPGPGPTISDRGHRAAGGHGRWAQARELRKRWRGSDGFKLGSGDGSEEMPIFSLFRVSHVTVIKRDQRLQKQPSLNGRVHDMQDYAGVQVEGRIKMRTFSI